MRAHTWMYVTDFTVPVDAVSRNFHFIRSVQKISAVAGFISRLTRLPDSLLLSPIMAGGFYHG